MIIYGIKNCDTMKKAFTWLDANRIAYTFHDYKKEGISKAKIKEWLQHFPATTLINTRGTTYKNLSEAEKASIGDTGKAMELMIAYTSMIKRPLVESDKGMLLGFDVKQWENALL